MKTLTPDLAERKRILKDICRNHPQWKIRIALAAVLFIAAVGVLGGTIGLLIRHPTSVDGIMAFIGSAICIGCVPFFCGLSVKNTAKYWCAFSYTSSIPLMSREISVESKEAESFRCRNGQKKMQR